MLTLKIVALHSHNNKTTTTTRNKLNQAANGMNDFDESKPVEAQDGHLDPLSQFALKCALFALRSNQSRRNTRGPATQCNLCPSETDSKLIWQTCNPIPRRTDMVCS